MSGNSPVDSMDMRIPHLNIQILLESNPLKSRILARRLAEQRVRCLSTRFSGGELGDTVHYAWVFLGSLPLWLPGRLPACPRARLLMSLPIRPARLIAVSHRRRDSGSGWRGGARAGERPALLAPQAPTFRHNARRIVLLSTAYRLVVAGAVATEAFFSS